MLVWPMSLEPKLQALPSPIDRDPGELRLVVRAVVSSILGAPPSHPDVDDATNETLRRAIEGRDRVRDGEPVRSWVVGIARNVARDVLRQRARTNKRAYHEPPSPPDSTRDVTERVPDSKPSPLDRAMRTEELARLVTALATLPDGQRRAIEMFHVEGKAYAEISAALGVPVGTVATWILRAREKLAGAMREEES